MDTAHTPYPSFSHRLSNLLYQTWTRKEIRIDLKEARAHHLHRCSPSRAFWRCLESLHNQTALGLRRRTVLIPPPFISKHRASRVLSSFRRLYLATYSSLTDTHHDTTDCMQNQSNNSLLILYHLCTCSLSLPPPASASVRACQATVPG